MLISYQLQKNVVGNKNACLHIVNRTPFTYFKHKLFIVSFFLSELGKSILKVLQCDSKREIYVVGLSWQELSVKGKGGCSFKCNRTLNRIKYLMFLRENL